MASFEDKKISPINDMIRAGIESNKSIYILINEVLSAHGKEELCEFQRSTDGTNPKRLWTDTKYTDEIANKYNHFTGKLISVCELLNKDTCTIENAKKVSDDIAEADKTSDEEDQNLSDLFGNLELKAGGKMKLGGQSGGSPFSNVLAIAMKISKMADPSEALTGIGELKIKSWLEALTLKAIKNKETCVAFLYNNVLAQVFPSIVASLKLTEAAVADPETIVAFLRTYIPIFINRIQEASITVGDAVETGAKMGAKAEEKVMGAISHMDISRTNLALNDLSFKMKEDEEERLQKKTNRLASLEKAQKKLTDAKVKAADVRTRLEEQKGILKEVKEIVAETKTFIEEKNMMSEELTQINNELELLMEEPEKKIENQDQDQKLEVPNAELIPPTAPELPRLSEKELAEQARIEQARIEQARIEQARKRPRDDDETNKTNETNKTQKPNPDGPNESKEGGKRKTKKQQKKASKTKKPKRSQKKQTKKRKQRKTQQKKGKK